MRRWFSHFRWTGIFAILSLPAMAGIFVILWVTCPSLMNWPGIIAILSVLLSIIAYLDMLLRAVEQARTNSKEAKEAVQQAIQEMRSNYYRYCLLTARSLMKEVNSCIQNKNWRTVGIRLADLADIACQIDSATPSVDDFWRSVPTSIRKWAFQFQQGSTNKTLEYDQAEWIKLYTRLHEKIDDEFGPFLTF